MREEVRKIGEGKEIHERKRERERERETTKEELSS